jgi:hypothetical protein
MIFRLSPSSFLLPPSYTPNPVVFVAKSILPEDGKTFHDY